MGDSLFFCRWSGNHVIPGAGASQVPGAMRVAGRGC